LTNTAPLYEKFRPTEIKDYLFSELSNKTLIESYLKNKNIPSIIFSGPAGCGKTTLAKIIGNSSDREFISFSAVLDGIPKIRSIVKDIKEGSILFVDEIHRFNKAQQDAFLPLIESGKIVLIGATTENPSYSLNKALLSRVKVIRLRSFKFDELKIIANNFLEKINFKIPNEHIELIIKNSNKDARLLLRIISEINELNLESKDQIQEYIQNSSFFNYDKNSKMHYDLISAFIKSLRGSDPDAALYYGFRIIMAGEDPRYVIRRMIIFAAEDISNSDPRAVLIAKNCLDCFNLIGMPEAEIIISQCITYLATAPKSNRSYIALKKVKDLINQNKNLEVPADLKDSSINYQYPHDFENSYIKNKSYLPNKIRNEILYSPSQRGYEKIIFERIKYLKK